MEEIQEQGQMFVAPNTVFVLQIVHALRAKWHWQFLLLSFSVSSNSQKIEIKDEKKKNTPQEEKQEETGGKVVLDGQVTWHSLTQLVC